MGQFDDILEEVFSKAKSAVNFAGQKTGELVGMGKLKYQKETLAREITKAYAKLGAIVYEANIGGGDLEGLTEVAVSELKDLNNQFDVVVKEMAKAKEDFSSPIEEKAKGVADDVKDNVVDLTDKMSEKAEKVADKIDDMFDDVDDIKITDDED